MNPPAETIPESDAIRSQIDDTKRRMDETLGALRERQAREAEDDKHGGERGQNLDGALHWRSP